MITAGEKWERAEERTENGKSHARHLRGQARASLGVRYSVDATARGMRAQGRRAQVWMLGCNPQGRKNSRRRKGRAASEPFGASKMRFKVKGRGRADVEGGEGVARRTRSWCVRPVCGCSST
eukprot:6183523-Pleurochrysis_carterae.AAC.6